MRDRKRIQAVPGFYDFHVENHGHRKSVSDVAETSINVAGGSDSVDYIQINKKFSLNRTSIKTLKGYVSRMVPTYQLLELFRDTRFGEPSGKVLDLGCGRGIHLRLLKGFGYIDEAVGIDIFDHCSGFDESSLRRFHRKFKLLRFAESVQDRIARKPPGAWSEIEYLIMSRVPTVRRFASDYGHRPDMGIYALRMRREPRMDRFIAGNVFELDEKFDIVTSFASLDWFSADQIFAKIADLLNENGFFYVWVTNWWHSINTTNIFGHFPFAAQRLSKEEFAQYAREEMPEHADDILKSYAYFDSAHPTLADLVDTAGRHGLVPLSWKQNVLPDQVRPRGGLSSLGISQLDHQEFVDSYADARGVNPELRQIDMYPYSNAILFQKISKSSRFSAATFPELSKSLSPPDPARSSGLRLVKSAGRRIFRMLS